MNRIFAKVLLGLFGVIGPLSISNAYVILPALIVTLAVCVYGLLKIPDLTAAILSGRTGIWVNPFGVVAMRETKVQSISETRFNRSEAAQKYLEQYGDPIVTNTYLKLTILVLAAVSLATLALFYRAQAALSSVKPLVIRINDVGRAEAVDYQNFAYKPQEAENRYFLSEWARAYYSRNHYTLHKDLTKALYFLNGDLQNAILEKYKKEKVIESFLLDPSQSNIDIEVKTVAIEDLRQPPFKARVEFYKIFTRPLDHTEQKREFWTANIVYTFRDQVRNEMLPVNPPGLGELSSRTG